MTSLFIAFCLGFTAGAAVQWWHFSHSKLIRNQAEWQRAVDAVNKLKEKP